MKQQGLKILLQAVFALREKHLFGEVVLIIPKSKTKIHLQPHYNPDFLKIYRKQSLKLVPHLLLVILHLLLVDPNVLIQTHTLVETFVFVGQDSTI